MQNTDGEFASYELIRGPWWLEWLNPAEVFGDIMVEHSYPECTTSVVTALSIFRRHYPKYRPSDIQCVVSLTLTFELLRTTSLGVWLRAPSTTCARPKSLKAAGSDRGASASRTPHSLRSSRFRWSARPTRPARRRARRANSSSRSSVPTGLGRELQVVRGRRVGRA